MGKDIELMNSIITSGLKDIKQDMRDIKVDVKELRLEYKNQNEIVHRLRSQNFVQFVFFGLCFVCFLALGVYLYEFADVETNNKGEKVIAIHQTIDNGNTSHMEVKNYESKTTIKKGFNIGK